MPLHYSVVHTTGNGETVSTSVMQLNPVTGEVMHNSEEMKQLLEDALAFNQGRVCEMNVKMLEAYGLSSHFTPQIWQRFVAMLDILAGRQSADMVARRWASEVEETRELEEARLSAAVHSNGVDNL